MWPVMAQSHPWTNVPSVDGAPTTVGIMKMQEWCVKVKGSVYMYFMHINVCQCALYVYMVHVYCECMCM